ncbi:30S ribosomal protein S12 methylthiotransferase RimO [Pelotomaculum terephthalicicum JT]|uniref:30S ribosomal protein S12 methylthiotransferase RimO n=1 Tax=Pelotomaculum TaxID=191373 RepID=UPI0009D3C498|nr:MULTISPECIES: 30S ribosomal protein S12 methylthiotransferase RimO [Pelotomaculum]MCG9968176.1 30S ribosomal protein S12 methylthiotransferase RimO [Pelotomaculum terephthalicicum JT]OPX83928.1 MAG: Ribosomal protein S12 methylthiotransferase RimO [Pelotomaculum sp. PtaB.Bin117]OPY63195.1 MAG: Ribosomal protein S12 methylthiotransferase RimO [Pelotomaculum sp. PtaU1.Bin065]
MSVKIGLVSLGCPKNLVDSEIMLGILKKDGFTVTNREKEADVLIINTCSFINDAKEESINTILELARLKEEGSCKAILVTGCMAQRYPKELTDEMPEIDGLLGTGTIREIAGAVKDVLTGKKVSLVRAPGFLCDANLPRLTSTPPHTAFLKIAEGCDNCCSYCVIPQIRGPLRSRPVDDIACEAAHLAAGGVKELVLVAQDTTRYGVDLYGKPALVDLLKQLAALDGPVWLRILYAYPDLLTDELIELMMSEKKVCRYLDLPLQHASNEVLKRMNRRGSPAEIIRLVEKLRSALPGITLRTSFITGFPGETEADFLELLDFMREIKFDRVGVFTYSQEEHTAAAKMPDQIPEEVKSERRDRAMAVQQKISLERNMKKIGSVIPVLIEGFHSIGGLKYFGRSEGDAPDIDGKVYIMSEVKLNPGDIVQVSVVDAAEYDLTGELV